MSSPTLASKREQVLAKVKELRASTAKPDESRYDELELELASLYPTLPMQWLTASLLTTGATFIGFLYNYGVGLYVSVDSDNKWLYATKSTTEGAVRWKLYQDSVGNLVATANIGGAEMFFNWRNTTGACKLYDSYDTMKAQDWADTMFKMFNPDDSEFIGTWSETDTELYNRQNISNLQFGFQFFATGSFTQDDKLIYRSYVKTR